MFGVVHIAKPAEVGDFVPSKNYAPYPLQLELDPLGVEPSNVTITS